MTMFLLLIMLMFKENGMMMTMMMMIIGNRTANANAAKTSANGESTDKIGAAGHCCEEDGQ